MYKPLQIFFLVFISLSFSGCYSFSGASLSPDMRTFSVQSFDNASGEGPSNLTQIVTENFKQYFQRNTNLKLVNNEGDLEFDGRITAFQISPATIQRVNGVDQAAQNRLTILIQVNFVNNKDPKQSFNQTFSAFNDFPQDQTLTQLPQSFYDNIIDQIVFSVFNKSVANW